MKRLWQFILDSYRELRYNVTWPSRKEVGGTTVIVLIMVSVLAVYFFVVDSALHESVRRFLKMFTAS